MKLPLRYTVLLYVVLPLVILCYLPTICTPYLTELNENSRLLYDELFTYASNNNGFLPNNYNLALENTQINEKILEQFGFAYGIDLNKIKRKNDQLYNEAGERILLIYPKGLRLWLKDRCNKFSLQLYDLRQIKESNTL